VYGLLERGLSCSRADKLEEAWALRRAENPKG
jgi:hypothetical protein